jgi:CDP-paratose 2-epimerase
MMKRSRNTGGKRPNGNSLGKLGAARLQARPTFHKTETQGGHVLITGGAGFIGANVAQSYLARGERVLIYDNLSRPGVERNLVWLRQTYGGLVRVEIGDVQDFPKLRQAVRGARKVFHFAAQVAVTTSLESPFYDFEVNARGTLNLLEALRELREPAPLIYTSTNKVYGNLSDVAMRAGASRYEPEEERLRLHGFSEERGLDFHSPYGCSKGAAEQYVLDYARTFHLPALVFRMSCIYGPRQFGTEDQGWVAHFLIRALKGSAITVYGDGKQVRDVLFISDLVDAFTLAQQKMGQLAGQAFNIGGGPANTISLLELIDLIEELQGIKLQVRFDQWRAADQPYYVSDIRKFSAATGWCPKVAARQGVGELCQWLKESRRSRLVPLVVPDGALGVGAKLPPNTVALGSSVPRSKRIWKMDGAQGEALDEKIIKFP